MPRRCARSGNSALPTAAQLALIRGWQTATLLVKNGMFTTGRSKTCTPSARSARSTSPGIPACEAEEANHFNVVERPYFFDAATALLRPGRGIPARYKFNIAPATDDQPYFFHFFKWRLLPELLSLRGRAVCRCWSRAIRSWWRRLQAVLASLLLIAAPAAWVTWVGAVGTSACRSAGSRDRVLVYFMAIGFAFMFIEIAFIQKFVLFLSHPLYAVAVVLFAFLLFAGIGSAVSRRLAGRRRAGACATRWQRWCWRLPVGGVLPRSCLPGCSSTRWGCRTRRAS